MLSEDRIAAAALRLAETARFEDLSMRAVAGALDVPVMTLYNYVASKDALATLIVDHVLRPVQVPESGPWDERIRELLADARAAMRRHPGLSLSRFGATSTESLRLADGVMEILASGGFVGADAVRAFAVLYTFVLGQVEVDAMVAISGGREEETLASVTEGGISNDELFEVGLDVVLRGLDATRRTSEVVRAPRRSARTPP